MEVMGGKREAGRRPVEGSIIIKKGGLAGSNFSVVIRNSGVLLFGSTNQSSGCFHAWLCS